MHLLHNYVRCEDDEQWYIECVYCLKRKPIAFKVTDSRVWDETVDPPGWTYYTTESPRQTPPALWLLYPTIWEYYGEETPV